MIKKISFLFLLFFSFNLIYAQSSSGFDLNDCLDYALKNSYLLTEHQIESAENQATLKAGKTDFLPEIDGYINYFQYLSDFPTYIFPEEEGRIISGGSATGPYPVGLGLPFNLQAGLTIDQVIFDKRFFLANDYTENISKIEVLKKELSQEDIIFNVSINYYKLLSLLSNVRMIDYNLNRIERIENMLQSQIENGFARELDKSRISLQRTKILAGREDLDGGIVKLTNYLKFLMGMPIEKQLSIKNQDIETATYSREVLDSMQIMSKQLDLLEMQQEVNDLQKNRTSAEYFPKISAFASLQAQAQRNAFNFFSGNEDWFLINLFGVKLDIPIMHGGDKKRQFEKAEIESSKIALNRLKLEENLKMQYESSYNELVGSLKKVRYAEDNVQTATNLYNQTEKMFSEGIVLLNELLETEALLKEMQVDKVKALYEYKLAEIKFMQATGTLLSINDQLNPEE